jgi:aldose 1-epimerase
MSNVIHLESPTLAVTLSNRGARLVQLVAKRQNLSLLIDTARVPTELIDQFCIGGTVGPFAGRLRRVDASNGQTAVSLHGGEAALHRADWLLEHSSEPNVAIYTVSRRHGEGGLPGDRDFSVAYTLSDNSLVIDLSVTTTHDTPISLTNHAYFTLGAASVSALSLQINAQSVLLTDAEQCATGGSMPVADTPLDFTRERPLSDALLANPDGLDHSYVLASGGRGALAPDLVASLSNRANGIRLDIATTQPCLQVYTASKLTSPLRPFTAICLEAQGFPNGPNHALGRSESWVAAGQTTKQRIVYRITEGSPTQ